MRMPFRYRRFDHILRLENKWSFSQIGHVRARVRT
jgi:hypothetical protein